MNWECSPPSSGVHCIIHAAADSSPSDLLLEGDETDFEIAQGSASRDNKY